MSWIQELYDIFVVVQNSKVFDDQKYFVDCSPKFDNHTIRSAFEKTKNTGGCIADFVEHNFSYPSEGDISNGINNDILEYIESFWSNLTIHRPKNEGSFIGLPHKTILVGGRFRETYYWDSYFTMLGLKLSNRGDLIKNIIDNFSYLIDSVGHIPNGNRSYFLSRSQPPFFSFMVELLSEIKGPNTLTSYASSLEKEYEFWMTGSDKLSPNVRSSHRVVALTDSQIANRYYDNLDTPRPESYMQDMDLLEEPSNHSKIFRNIRAACESGWDHSSRWLRIPSDLSTAYTTDIIPVDLNCLLYNLEITIAKCYTQSDNIKEADIFKYKAQQRADIINSLLWDDQSGLYRDYDFVENKITPCISLASLFPLFIKIAPQSKAEKVLDYIEKHLLKEGGLITTQLLTGQQWDAPNAWAPLQYIAYIAAKNYDYNALALKIKTSWMSNVNSSFIDSGMLMEKYDAIDTHKKATGGEYANQVGFGWTNGVYLAFHFDNSNF